MKKLFSINSTFLKESTSRFNKYISLFLTLIYPILSSFFSSMVCMPIMFIFIFINAAQHKIINEESPFFKISLMLFSFLACLIFYILVVKFVDKRNIASLGFKRSKNIFKSYITGFCIGILMISMVILISYFFNGYEIQFNGVFNFSLPLFILILFMWIIQGTAEEIMMRGYTLPIISNSLNIPLGIFISSLYFSLLHLWNNEINFIALLNLFFSGIFFALYALYTNNLWGVSALHSAWNFAQANIFGVPVSGITNLGNSIFNFFPKENFLINGGNFGPEGGIIITFVIISSIIILLILQLKKVKSIKS